MQAYQGLSVGTATPNLEELQGIRHHMLDIWPISHPAHVAEFQDLARTCINKVQSVGEVPIIVGGSVLYVNAVLDVFEFPGTDPAIRAEYQDLLDAEGPEFLHRILESKDSEAASHIQVTNGRRIVRALEVIKVTGKPFRASLPPVPTEFVPTCRIGIEMDRETMDRRIEQRIDRMLDHGLLDEVEAAIAVGLRESVTASKAIGYSHMIQVLDGEITLEDARSHMVLTTRKFARRQQRWFRQDPRITWFNWDAEDLHTKVLAHFDEVLRTHKGGK